MNGKTSFADFVRLFDFSRPQAFIFDLDGTLVDSDRWHVEAFRITLAEHAVEVLKQFDSSSIKGRGTPDVFRSIGITSEERVSFLTEIKRRNFSRFLDEGAIQPFPFANNLVDFLYSQDRILLIVTGSGAHTAKASLRAGGFEGLFKHVVTVDEVRAGKPQPDLFRRALQLAGVQPHSAVTIEDAVIGVEASRSAGIEAVLVNQDGPSTVAATFHTIEDLYLRVLRDFAADRRYRKSSQDAHETSCCDEGGVEGRLFGGDGFTAGEIIDILGLATETGQRVRLLCSDIEMLVPYSTDVTGNELVMKALRTAIVTPRGPSIDRTCMIFIAIMFLTCGFGTPRSTLVSTGSNFDAA